MVTWELLGNSADASGWDRDLSAGADANVFQSYGWGEFKRVCGWSPMRWIARDRDRVVVGLVQILTKTLLPGVRIGWAPGGPVCIFSEHTGQRPEDLVSALLEAIKSNYRIFCVRFDSYAPLGSSLADAFKLVLVRPLFKLNTGSSLYFNLENSLDELRARMTAKHRYYVKKALNEKLDWKAGSDDQSVQALLQLHNEMVLNKRLDSLRTSSNEVASLCRILGTSAVIFTGYAHDVPVTSCLVLLFERKAFYWMAATGAKGREISASYAMVYRLLEYLQRLGIKQLDFGGLAPGSPLTEGVNHFKRGFGGEIVEYLGEWEWSSDTWLRWVFNQAIRRWSGRL